MFAKAQKLIFMKKDKSLQSRREFFKNAAKKVLPVIGTIAIANVFNIVKAEETSMGCTGTCYMTCKNACQGCRYSCDGTCKNSCTGCRYTCDNTCKNGCYHTNR